MANKEKLINRIQQGIEAAIKLDAEDEGFLLEILLDNTGNIYLPLFARSVLGLLDEGALKRIWKDVSGLLDESKDHVPGVPAEETAAHVA
jgi:hypothetical protein